MKYLNFINLSLFIVLAIVFSSCEEYECVDSGMPISIQTAIHEDMPEEISDALLASEPFHVVVYHWNYCDPNAEYKYFYEADAYIDAMGKLHWVDGKKHNWSWYWMKFVAYYPADANVKFNKTGVVLDSDCTVLGTCYGRYDKGSEILHLYYRNYSDKKTVGNL